ncbi:MAG: NAD-binding protein, partial [Candidatus Aenigmatarchaeota archaeon]
MLKEIGKFLGKLPLYNKVILILIVYFICAGAIFFYLEKGRNPRINDLFDAYWLLLVFYLSGLEDFGPVTVIGKFLSLSIFILGLLTVATVIGKITSVLVLRAQKEVKMPENVSDHIAICNWNVRGDRIIKEIHNPVVEPETEIIIVTDKKVDEQELRKSKEYEKVYFIAGDPTLHDVLRSARVHLAKSVIILADEECPDPDAKSALIALAITKLEKELPRKPHIVAEVVNHRKISHLLDAGVDEYVCAVDYGLGILAQSALYQKVSNIYQQLLSYSKDTNEIYIVPRQRYDNILLGKTFSELNEILDKNRESDNPV